MTNSRKKDDEKAMKNNNARLDNKSFLQMQMEEKRAQKNMERMSGYTIHQILLDILFFLQRIIFYSMIMKIFVVLFFLNGWQKMRLN